LCYYGNGGFSPIELYELPVYLRNFYYKKLIDAKEKEADQQKEASRTPKSNKIDRPGFR